MENSTIYFEMSLSNNYMYFYAHAIYLIEQIKDREYLIDYEHV